MGYIYSNQERETEEHALPNVEVFTVDYYLNGMETDCAVLGWYWWSCFPGCLPDGEPFGPFGTEAEAIANAQERQ